MKGKDRGGERVTRKAGAGTTSAGLASQDIASSLAAALGYHKAGQFAAAEDAYRRILSVVPDHANTLHYLGILCHQMGRSDTAVELIERAIARNSGVAEFHYNLGVVLEALKRADAAAAHYRKATALNRGHANAYLNLGNVLLGQNKLDEAEAACRRAAALNPHSTDAPYNLGIVLARLHRYDEAIAQFRAVVQSNPAHAAAHANLGVAYSATGDLGQAAYHCRQCLALDPRNHQAAVHLGLARLAQGDAGEALELALHALAIEDTPPSRYLFSRAARHARAMAEYPPFREFLRRALAEAWDSPTNLMRPAVSLIKMNAVVRAAIEGQNAALPQALSVAELCDATGLAQIAGDRLLLELLRAAPICDAELERMLTVIRRGLLDLAADEGTPTIPDSVLQFYCALAQQCFANEYVYAVTAAEQDRAEALAERLERAATDAADVPALWLAAIGAYRPLHALTSAELLLRRDWPAAVTALTRQQIAEPKEQNELRGSIPNLTAIEDDTSLAVKRQYEENPYPRWHVVGAMPPPLPLDVYMASRFRHGAYKPLGKDRIDVLIAGCGTGQHAIETSRKFVGANILAVDLSAASLAYALRKTRELGLTNIRYGVADILKLDTLGLSFDVIEASGVLHHLADPMGAWRQLLSMLKPGGVMNVGLYSELGRAHVVHARAFIAERDFQGTAGGIRRCRQDMAACSNDPLLTAAMESTDFFSMSECRDLLFHVQEHRMTLPQIAAFIGETKLTFLGFDADATLLKQYEVRFPADPAKTDLASWHQFELENPRSFAGMYQFWVQKP